MDNKINGEFKDVFVELDSEYIARTYLMAKNIADNTRLVEQNAQYDKRDVTSLFLQKVAKAQWLIRNPRNVQL